jgi:hypothetical protein
MFEDGTHKGGDDAHAADYRPTGRRWPESPGLRGPSTGIPCSRDPLTGTQLPGSR